MKKEEVIVHYNMLLFLLTSMLLFSSSIRARIVSEDMAVLIAKKFVSMPEKELKRIPFIIIPRA